MAKYKTNEGVSTDQLNYGPASIISAAKVLSASDTRLSFIISPINGDIYVGSNSSLTPSNGLKISQGNSLQSDWYIGEVWAVCGASAAVDVRYWEEG